MGDYGKTQCSSAILRIDIDRPFHLKIPGGPKMARAALRRMAIDGPFAVKLRKCGRRLFDVWRLVGPLMACTDPC